MKEQEWKKAEQDLKSKSPPDLYNWRIGNKSYTVTLELNGDGIKAGDLRIISLFISSSDGIDTVAQHRDNIFDPTLQYPPDLFQTKACSETRFQTVLEALKERYGKPDSVIYELRPLWKRNESVDPFNPNYMQESGKDTTTWIYHFHVNESIVLLIRGKLVQQSRYIPFDHYENASVHQIHENYESQLADLIEARRKSLTPKDIVSIPVYTSVGNNANQYGDQEKVLILTAIVGNPIGQRLASEENRSISSVKGRFVIKDNHGDSLLSYPDFKIDLQQPLKSYYYPGLKYAIGNEDFTYIYTETKKAVFIRMNHPDIPPELKRAFNNGEKITAIFIPESILFTDGTILKD